MKQMTIKPIVKYIGGKSWLGDKLREKLEIDGAPTSYGEAFFGGGGFSLSDEFLIKIFITYGQSDGFFYQTTGL